MNKEVNLLNKNEDYLDQLLNQISKNEQTKDEVQLNQLSKDLDLDRNEEKPSEKHNEDDFIRQFESEMDEFDSERLISEFELELDQVPFEPEVEESNINNDFFAGLNEAMGRKDSIEFDEVLRVEEEPTERSIEIEDIIEENIFDEKPTDEKPTDENGINEEYFDTGVNDIQASAVDINMMEEQPSNDRKQVNLDSDEDILELLAGLAGDDEEISDIANMLKADENHEPIQDDGFLDMDQELKNIAETKLDEEAEVDVKKKKKIKKNKIKKENDMLAKLSKTIFGEDEVNAAEIINVPIHELDGTETPEELEIIENLKNADIVIKSKEDQEKDEKQKLVQEKKAEKEKASQEKKKEKDAKKAEKKANKAEKPAKVKIKDKTPPLPKVSVILIFLMSISFLLFILLATKGSGYQLAIKQTQELYKEEKYVEAYAKIAGVELKEANIPLRNKVILLAGLQEEYSAYTTFFKIKKYEQALDALVRGVGRYYDGLEAAKALGVVSEYGVEYARLQESLSLNFKITDEEAIKLYQMKKRNLYSAELVQIVNKLTFQ